MTIAVRLRRGVHGFRARRFAAPRNDALVRNRGLEPRLSCYTQVRLVRANRGEDVMRVLPFIEQKLPWAVKRGKVTWVVKYASLSVALLVLIVVVSRHVLGLDALSYTDPIGIAAILGLVGVIGLGVALMAATFYSARSGMDEQAGDARDVHYDEKPRNKSG